MAFKASDFSSFCIGFSKNSRLDFGTFARGYHNSANKLFEQLSSQNHVSDYEAYPVVFLYRHSLELYLKNTIYRAAMLAAFREIEQLDNSLFNKHELDKLGNKFREIMNIIFPNDLDLKRLVDGILDINNMMKEIDNE